MELIFKNSIATQFFWNDYKLYAKNYIAFSSTIIFIDLSVNNSVRSSFSFVEIKELEPTWFMRESVTLLIQFINIWRIVKRLYCDLSNCYHYTC